MATITVFHPATIHQNNLVKISFFHRFLSWCGGQQQNRLLWLGASLAIHGCMLTPITLVSVLLSGANPVLLFLTAASMGTTLVVNLAAMPTRISIPVFMGSVLLSVAVLVAAFSTGIDLSKAF